MYCNKCGNQVLPGTSFCPKCGNNLQQSSINNNLNNNQQININNNLNNNQQLNNQSKKSNLFKIWLILFFGGGMGVLALGIILKFVIGIIFSNDMVGIKPIYNLIGSLTSFISFLCCFASIILLFVIIIKKICEALDKSNN